MKKMSLALMVAGGLLTACGPALEEQGGSEERQTPDPAPVGKVGALDATTWQLNSVVNCYSKLGYSCYRLKWSPLCATYTGTNDSAQGIACSVPGTYCWTVTDQAAVSYLCK